MPHVAQVGKPPDRAVAAIALSQYGVVTRDQMLDAGLGPGAIAHRCSRGRLHRLHRGVYLVGHAVAPHLALEMAALMACRPDALLSYRSSTWLWRLGPRPQGEIDVTVVGRHAGSRRGVGVHETGSLDDRDRARRHGLAVTTPARTLLDLAEVASPRELERAFDEALTQRLVDRHALEDVLHRTPGRRGAAAITALLRRDAGPTLTRSEAEECMLGLVRSARLPRPQVNARVAGHEVDLFWRDERLVVEVDGYRFHSSRAAFERDRRRDADLGAAGLRVMRITWRALVDEPQVVLGRLAAALAQRGAL